jgi:hypothetical protein
LLTCVVNGNMYMSHDALHRCRKGRTTERGSRLADARHRTGRRGLGSVAGFWIVAPASIPLPRRGGGDRPFRSCHGTLGSNHAEDPRQRRARSAQLFCSKRINTGRYCCACRLEISQGNAQAWLRGAKERIARSVSTTPLIVCSPRNSSRSTRFSFPTEYALLAIALR